MATGTDGLPEEQSKMATSLNSLLVQLDHKEKLLTDLDTKIFQLVKDEEELETEVFEEGEIQSKFSETLSNIKSFITRLLHRGDEALIFRAP